jgi:DNA-binding transcriptional ArsR family regulator
MFANIMLTHILTFANIINMNDFSGIFSNITRVKILSCLAEKNKNVTDLIRNCGLSQSAVSQHLKKLKNMGMVDYEIKGRERLYRLKHFEAGDISNRILKLIKCK